MGREKKPIKRFKYVGIARPGIPYNKATFYGLFWINSPVALLTSYRNTSNSNMWPMLGHELLSLQPMLLFSQIALSSGQEELPVCKPILFLGERVRLFQFGDLIVRPFGKVFSRYCQPAGCPEQPPSDYGEPDSSNYGGESGMLVQKDEQPHDKGRYDIMTGALIWGAILALCACLYYRDEARSGQKTVNREENNSPKKDDAG